METKGEAADAWQHRWVNGQTGWDQGREHALLEQLVAHAQLQGPLIKPARIFSAGCGRAHNEAWLARQGFQVDAVDIVPDAIAKAKELYAEQEGLSLSVADAFARDEAAFLYDAVFDRAMLCAIGPEHRKAYVQRIHEKLKPEGLFMAILFRRVRSPNGPPFAVDENDALALFDAEFNLCHASSCALIANPHSVLEEWLCIWRKKVEAK